MANETIQSGLLRIANEADRIAVASILYKNGYTVKPHRYKKNGKSYEYCVQYSIENTETAGGLT